MVGQKLPALPGFPGTANSPHKFQTQSSTNGSGVRRNPIFCHSTSLREQWLSSTLRGKYLFKIGQLRVSEKGEAKLTCHSSMVRNSPMGWLWRARKPGPGTKGHREKHPFSLESWTRLYRLKVSLKTDSPGQTQALEQLICHPCFIAGERGARVEYVTHTCRVTMLLKKTSCTEFRAVFASPLFMPLWETP